MRRILFALIVTLLINGCTEKGEDKVFLLPKDFIGYAVILYNQSDGSEMQYINEDKRLFEIPPSRVLKTKFKADYGRTSFPDFYYESISDQNRIPLVIDAVEYSEGDVNASMPNIGKVYPEDKEIEPTEYSIFFIGTKEDIERASKEVAKIDILELI